MINFSLRLPVKIDFGWGSTNNLAAHINAFGNSALIFTGQSALTESGIAGNILDSLSNVGITYKIIKIAYEPTVELIDFIVSELKSSGDEFDVMVAIGGGSVIDSAKAVSAMIHETGSVGDFIEGVGGKTLEGKAYPIIAVPSTAGTGSEATCSAVITKKKDGCYKGHLRHESLMPQVALIDPSLLITLPHNTMLYCAMESFCRLLESYTSKDSNEFVDVLMLEGIKKLMDNLPTALSRADAGKEAFDNLAYSSFLSGIGAANSSMTVTQGIAHAIGAFYDIPHGAVCAAVFYAATLTTMRKVQMFDPNSTATAKFAMFGAAVSGLDYDFDKHHVLLRAANDVMSSMRKEFDICGLEKLGVRKTDFYKIASHVDTGGNPAPLAETEIMEILEMSWK